MITTLLLSLALSAQDAGAAIQDDLSEPAIAASMTEDERAETLAAINAALNGIDTLQARFVQTAPDFSTATGTLSVRRPGRLRFEYDEPTPMLIVSDGTTVAVRDTALETTDRVPLRSTPLWWILADDVDIGRDAFVREVWEQDGFIHVGIEDRGEEVEGNALFLFDADTYLLSQWFVTDAAGMTTRIALEGVETGVSFDPRLFVLDDEDERDDRRRGR
ncbi:MULTISPECIES: LolA family protein [Hyphobacterium]|uniref:Outer membrane lipoprotein carrier protein LolA n=1 Tax=Hyphobacterium vulgare TaxID=1736751 RepID=A0ABV6ZWL7_9PROT